MDPFTRWCRDELYTPDIVSAAALLERACDLLLVQVFRKLDLGSLLVEPRTPRELVDALGYVETADITLDAMLFRLVKNTPHVTLRERGDGTWTYQVAAPTHDVSKVLCETWRAFDDLGPDYAACRRFVEFGVEHFECALKTDPEFLDRILSGREPEFAELWDEATNRDPLQDVHGIMGAKAISSFFEGGTILEIGGGTGNGIRHLLGRFQSIGRLDQIEKYIFTDIALSFVVKTHRAITRQYPTVRGEWRHLDINKPFGTQKVEAESIDLIYGVNSAHVARDVVGAMSECRKALRPGGMAVFAERVRLDPRVMAPREITLNLSVYHRTAAERNPDYRPMHCYLTPENWEAVLDLAGFSDAIVCPDFALLSDGFPDQYASVILAQK